MSEANPCPTCGYQIDRVERLNTENARLRAALKEIADMPPLRSFNSDGSPAVYDAEQKVARRALEQKADGQ